MATPTITTPATDTPTDRIAGVSQNPNVPNADGTAFDSQNKAPVLRYTGLGASGSTVTPYFTASGQKVTGLDTSGNPVYGQLTEDEQANQDRTSALNSVQGRLDSINSTFASNLSSLNQTNANLIGGTRAKNAREGLLGSDFGDANQAQANDKAQANITKLQNNRDTQLNTIYDAINKDVTAKAAARQTQNNKLTDSQNKTLQTNAQNYIKNLAKSGGSLDKLTQDEYNHLAEATGMSDSELHAAYVANIPADKIVSSSIKNGQYIQVSRDPITGEIKTNIVPVQGVPEGYTYNASIQAFVPKDGIDSSKPVSDQIIPYAKAVNPKTPKPGSTKPVAGAPKGVTQDDIAAGTTKLESAKGPDHYVDPYLYQSMYTHWTQNGGSPTAFTKNYPPKSYINPTDSKLLPTYLRPPAVKTSKASGA